MPQSRLSEVIASYPPATLGITAVCVACYVYTLLVDVDLGDVAHNPYLIIYQRQLYRIFTGTVFHAGITHIAMNMLSLQAMGTSLERLFGSTMFIILNIGLILLSGGVYLAVTWLCTLVTGDISWLMYSSVGYSGILFAFASLESFLSPAPTRSLFGMITVPTRLYPWALLIVLQLLPNISLLGHLSGLIVGMLYSAGLLSWAFPSFPGVQELVRKAFMARFAALRGFAPCPDSSPVSGTAANGDNRPTIVVACEAVGKALAPLWRCVRSPIMAVYNALVVPVIAVASNTIGSVRQTAAGGATPAATGRGTDWGSGTIAGRQAQRDLELGRRATTAASLPRAVAPRHPAAGALSVARPVRSAPATSTTNTSRPAGDCDPPASAEDGTDHEPTDAELYDFEVPDGAVAGDSVDPHHDADDDDDAGDAHETSPLVQQARVSNGASAGASGHVQDSGDDDSGSDVERRPLLP